jgi:hypothetical protein
VTDTGRPGRPDESPLAIYVTEREFSLDRPRIVVRVQGDPTAQAPVLRARLREVIPSAVIELPQALDTAVRSTLLLQRLYARGFSAFALMAPGRKRPQTLTGLSGSWNGSDRSSTPSTTENTATLAPMPRASVSVTNAA